MNYIHQPFLLGTLAIDKFAKGKTKDGFNRLMMAETHVFMGVLFLICLYEHNIIC